MSLPIFTPPRIENMRPVGRAPRSFSEQVGDSFSAMRRIDNFNARAMFMDEVWSERIAEVERVTGQRLPHPNSPGQRLSRFINNTVFPDEDSHPDVERSIAEADLERQIEALRTQNPEFAEALEGGEAWQVQLRQRLADLDARASDVDFVPGLIGGVGAAFTDPVNVATGVFAPASGGRTLGAAVARAAGVEASINAALEAANIPAANRWRREMGLDTTDLFSAQGAQRVAAGAAFGAAFGGGARAVDFTVRERVASWSEAKTAQALRELAPDDPEAMRIAAALERQSDLAEATPFARSDDTLEAFEARAEHAQRLDDAMAVIRDRDGPDGAAALARLDEGVMARLADARDPDLAIDGFRFPDRLHARMYRLGRSGEPDESEAQALLDAFKGFATEEDGYSELGSAADMIAYARGYVDDIRELGEAFDVVEGDRLREWQQRHGTPAPDPAAVSLPAGLAALDPRSLEVDAGRFQFKEGGDAAGVTDRLRDVEAWDPVRAGIALVFEQADGRLFIADGHQRRGLAARLLERDPDADIQLTAHVFREADGYTDAQVRAIAAAKNLAEGTGTAVDAAKVLRADPSLLDASLPRSSAMIRDAQGLMRLSDGAFGAVINDVVPASQGAIVGRLVSGADEQLAVIGVLARAEPASAFEAEAVVRQAVAAGFRKVQGEAADLFGAVPTESLFADRARVLSRAAAILRKEKQVFSTLSREADTIEGAGNQLARTGNEQRADTNARLLDVLQALAHRTGPVSEALTRAARDADGNYAAGARQFADELSRLADEGGLDGLLAGRSGRDADPAAPVQRPARETFSIDEAPQAAQAQRSFADYSDVDGPGQQRQAAALEARQTALLETRADDVFPTARLSEDGGEIRAELVTRREIEADLAADRAAVERFRGCVT